MLIFLLLELYIEYSLADGQFAQFLNLLQIIFDGLLRNGLQIVQSSIVYVRIFVVVELFVVYLVEVTEFVLELSEENGFSFLLDLGFLVVARRGLFLWSSWGEDAR